MAHRTLGLEWLNPNPDFPLPAELCGCTVVGPRLCLWAQGSPLLRRRPRSLGFRHGHRAVAWWLGHAHKHR